MTDWRPKPGEIALAAFLLLLTGAFLLPEYRTFGLRRDRAEVGLILTALQQYYLRTPPSKPFGPIPRPPTKIGSQTVSWDSSGLPGFRSPLNQVRGTYGLSLHDGTWTLHGMIDADGDGEPARYEAQIDGVITRLTPALTY